MCLGDSERATSVYANGQPHSLRENSKDSDGLHGTGLKSTEGDRESGPGEQHQQRSTTAISSSENLNIDDSKSKDFNSDNQKDDSQQEKSQDIALITIRVETHSEQHKIEFIQDKDDHVVTIHVLNASTARSTQEQLSSSDLEVYPHSLGEGKRPDPFAPSHSPGLSANRPPEECLPNGEIHGVSMKHINSYLRELWFKAYYYGCKNSAHKKNTIPTFLSEMDIPAEDSKEKPLMKLVLGPMQARLLQSKELILDIYFEEAQFFGETNRGQGRLNDVKISFLVAVKVTETKQIELDFKDKNCHEYPSSLESTEFKGLLVKYAIPCLFKELDASGLSTIPRPKPPFDSVNKSPKEDEILACEKIHDKVINDHSYKDFNFIMTLTQQSINDRFRQLWETANSENGRRESKPSFVYFIYSVQGHGESFFSSTFQAPIIQLKCERGSRSVILYIPLEKGQFKPLSPDKQLRPDAEYCFFSNWRLAFDIELDIEDSPKKTEQDTSCSHLNDQPSAGFKQLVLRLETAEPNLNLSSLPGLFEDDDYLKFSPHFNAIVYYIQTHYFPVLTQGAHHILHKIPKNVSHIEQSTNLNILFDVVPFRSMPESPVRQDDQGEPSYIFDRDSIVIWCPKDAKLGTPEPVRYFSGINWVTRKDIPYGSLCLPYDTFVETLVLLECVNRGTTVVSILSELINGERTIKPAILESIPRMPKEDPCVWQSRLDGSLEYVYQERDSLIYSQGGCSDNKRYRIDSIIENKLLPKSGTPVIEIKGEVKLSLSYWTQREKKDEKIWGADISVNWKADVELKSSPSGLRASLQQQSVVPTFRKDPVDRNGQNVDYSFCDTIFEQVKNTFSKDIDCKNFVSGWNSHLAGSWLGLYEIANELCVARPVFNKYGDLFLELAVQSPVSEPLTVPAS